MKDARQSVALKLLPSLADFAFLMPIAFLFGRMDGIKTLLSDCDTGWHIRTGEWIVANHEPGEPFKLDELMNQQLGENIDQIRV